MSKVLNLNKDWLFLKEAVKREELDPKKMAPINIPHTWNNLDGQDGGNNYHRGLTWYRKSFLNKEKQNGKVYLEFEGVNSVCDVYLNGTHLGRHEGGYSRFRMDVSQTIAYENILEVAVDNSHIEEVYPLWADFTFYGGIYRDVNLIYCNHVHFNKMDLASSGVYVSQTEITDELAKIKIQALVDNDQQANNVTCQLKWLDANDQVILEKIKPVKPDDQSIEFHIEINDPLLWNGIENPYLYTCLVKLIVDDKESDRQEIPIGLRYFEFDEEKGFFLNGKRLQLNGVSRHQDRENIGNALTKEHQIEDMELIKEIGANSIRLAHYQHNDYFYHLCDEAGMIVWAEIPFISKTSDTDLTNSNAISQMRELIRQNYNHSSIIMWGIQNEIGILGEERPLEDIFKLINNVAKEEDSTRLTTQAQVMMISNDDPSHYVTDLLGWNKYYGWYLGQAEEFDSFINSFRDVNPKKAFCISEYGAEGILSLHSDQPTVNDYTEEYHSLYHEKTLKIFNKYDFIWGTYVWNMFDFGSDTRDEGGVQGRNNKGLVTFDRKTKKDAFYWYQSMWSKAPMLHITSKRFIDRHTKNILVKIYSNQEVVTLTHQGKPVELSEKDGSIFKFNLSLEDGDNEIIAHANGLTDQAIFKKVEKPNSLYILPEEERNKGIDLNPQENVQNWFNVDLDDQPGVLEFPEGVLTIKEPIRIILENEAGEKVLKTYLEPMFNHPMFDMIMGLSLEQVGNLQPDILPQQVLSVINNQLINIKK